MMSTGLAWLGKRVSVNRAINFTVHVGNLLPTQDTVSFSVRNLLHGVSNGDKNRSLPSRLPRLILRRFRKIANSDY